LKRSLISLNDLGYTGGIACVFEALAALDALEGRPERAAGLIGAAEALLGAADVPLEPAEYALHVRTLEKLERELGESNVDHLRTHARSMPLAASVELALAADTRYELQDRFFAGA
jgi:hypothetical protein